MLGLAFGLGSRSSGRLSWAQSVKSYSSWVAGNGPQHRDSVATDGICALRGRARVRPARQRLRMEQYHADLADVSSAAAERSAAAVHGTGMPLTRGSMSPGRAPDQAGTRSRSSKSAADAAPQPAPRLTTSFTRASSPALCGIM